MTDVLLPVYLNQVVVFDMVAMLNDGLVTVSTVQSRIESADTEQTRIQARFGLSEALASLFTVGVEGQRERGSRDTAEDTRSEQRVHTPASLLKKLRDSLAEADSLGTLDGEVQSGHIIEFECLLRRNPVLQAFNQMIQGMETAQAFASHAPTPQLHQEPHRNRKHLSKATAPDPEAEAGQRFSVMAKQFRDIFKAGGTTDLLADGIGTDMRAVLTLDERYLNDPLMADLVDGQFRVLGKVIRVIRAEEGGISLLRKTAFSSMQAEMVTELLGNFERSLSESSVSIPKLEWFVSAPVVHVLPIGIYV